MFKITQALYIIGLAPMNYFNALTNLIKSHTRFSNLHVYLRLDNMQQS
jgi:hypothetical protein